ncbi:MAG: penicillin-binding transpeptidase domain-containing protein [Microgenomates group bacterium]
MTRDENNDWQYWLLNWGLVATFGILGVAIVRVSVIRGSFYRGLAFDNKIVETILPASRGEIVDRKGRLVAKSIYQFWQTVDGQKEYLNSGDYEGAKFEGKDRYWDIKRQYNYKESMGLLTGYVGLINESEKGMSTCSGLKLRNDDVIGRGGVEEYLDCELRGISGRRLVEIDAKGKYVRELGREVPVGGKKIELSIDAYWQEKIYQMLGGRKAVVIISEPKTGKILVMVSSPSIDANNFSFLQDNKAIKSYLEDTANLPLLNRAIGTRYHPGSVYKLVMATAGMETGVVDKNTTIEDTGVIKVGDYSYSNWAWTKGGVTDGMVNVTGALRRSNDIYFYKLGERLGVDNIHNWSDKFGYGDKTGVELAGEQAGINPSDKWKQENKGERWYLGDTYHLSIGQGFLGVTPLQVNQSTNIIANNGVKCSMSILKNSKPNCQSIGAKLANIEVVKEGMYEACHSGGTAWPLFNFKTKLACKTGTAEVGDGSKDTHAWLTAFAPADNPEISITVMVERGGEGSDVAAPIVGDILKEWFNEPNTLVPRYTEKK